MNKWLELNIFLKDYGKTNEVLKEAIKPYIDDLYKNEVMFHWHFFREPQICFRILASELAIKEMKGELDTKFCRLEKIKPDLYDKHFFGQHGQAGKEYDGEVDFYGADVWELCYKRWEAGSNLAILLVTTEPTKSIPFHYTRDIHLFENELGLEYSDAITIYLKWVKRLMECDKDFDYSAYLPVLQGMVEKLYRPSKIRGI